MNKLNIAALAAVATLAAVTIIVTKPGDTQPKASEWVIPDCVDDKTPVDCRFGGPWAVGGNPVWRGCNVGPAAHAVGTQCIAAPPVTILGNRLEKRGGQVVEVDAKTGATLAERVKDAGVTDAGKTSDAGQGAK